MSRSRRDVKEVELDNINREIVNRYQGGFPLCERPFQEVGQALGVSEEEAMRRIQGLLDKGVLSRFGPMYHAERLGGGLTLAAMKIPEDEFDAVVEQVNDFPEVAHNYAREHELNMWFVLATETPEGIEETCKRIEEKTGYRVYNMPKKQEFFVGLRFEA